MLTLTFRTDTPEFYTTPRASAARILRELAAMLDTTHETDGPIRDAARVHIGAWSFTDHRSMGVPRETY